MKLMKNGIAVLVAVGVALSFASLPVMAEETAGEKIEASAGDVKKDAKKTGRKMKKSFRDTTGNKSRSKDARDDMHNAGDDMSNEAGKAKEKID